MSWSDVKEIVQFAYNISGVLLVIGVFAAIWQLKLLKKDMMDRNRRASVEKSIESLKDYAIRIIPAMSEYNQKFLKEVPSPSDTRHLFDGKFNIPLNSLEKKLIVELIIKQNVGLVQIFNELEFFSATIIARLAVDEIVFTPVAKNFCEFIEREHLLLATLRNKGIPYKNLIELYRKWSDRLEVEKYQLQKQEAEHRIKLKGSSYKIDPPIGLN